MSVAYRGIFTETRYRSVYLAGRTLKALVRPDIGTTRISFRYTDLVDVAWVPLHRESGEIYLSVHANISLASIGSRFARRVELAELYDADVLLGRDLLRSFISFSRASTSTNCLAAPSANVYPLRGAT